MGGRRSAAPAAAALAALPLLLFWKVVFRGEVFYERDIHLIFLGQTETFVRAVAAGSWPVWDPYPGLGQPMLANPDAQVLYPPTWLNLVMSTGTYYTLFVLSHLLFSGLGLRALARRLGLSGGGACAAAALWMLSGPLLSVVNVWHHFASAAWIPWVLLAADRAVASGRRLDAVLWGAAMAAQVLGGSADMSAMTALLTVAFVAVRAREAILPGFRIVLMTAGAGILALALSAGLWLPTLDVAARSDRWHLPAETRTAWSVHPASLAQALLPLPLHALPLHPRWRAVLFESREPFLMSIYLGALAVGLAAAALAGPRRRGRGLFAVTAVVATLAALGKHTPFYDLLTTLVFPLRLIRYPSKAMVFAAFAVALLAGMGYDDWRAGLSTDAGRRRRVAVPLLALAAAAFAAAFAAWSAAPAVTRWLLAPEVSAGEAAVALAPLAVRLFAVGAACALAAVLVWKSKRTSAAAAVTGLAVVDLFAAHAALNPTVPRKVLAYRPATLDYVEPQDHSRLYVYDYYGVAGKSERYLKRDLQEPRGLRESWPYPFADVIARRAYLLPPVGEIWRLYGSYDMDMRGLCPWPQARLALLLRAIEGTPGHLRLLRMGAVSRVIAYHSEGFEDLVPLATLPGFGPEPIRIFGVRDPLPRAYVVSGARIADGRAAFLALVDPAFDARREVVLPEGTASPPDPAFAGAARILELAADRVRLEVDLSAPGYVVLVDSYDPGWRASVDGAEASVFRANVAFRAVPVAAGRHVVEHVYRPRPVLAGISIMAGGLVVAAIAAITSRRGTPP